MLQVVRKEIWRLSHQQESTDPISVITFHNTVECRPVPLSAVQLVQTLLFLVPGERRLGNWTFCVTGPTAWNSLLSDIPTTWLYFFSHYFQESTQDSFIQAVILFNIISSVACCSDFMDMLRHLINCRIIVIIIIIIVIVVVVVVVVVDICLSTKFSGELTMWWWRC